MSTDLAHSVILLERDVTRTLGAVHCRVVRDALETVTRLAPADPAAKLVEDVQQYFHDTFVDTTWPAGPRHHGHPLWYADGAWWCDHDHAMIARLGELPAGPEPADR
jgi:hypothetical protein